MVGRADRAAHCSPPEEDRLLALPDGTRRYYRQCRVEVVLHTGSWGLYLALVVVGHNNPSGLVKGSTQPGRPVAGSPGMARPASYRNQHIDPDWTESEKGRIVPEPRAAVRLGIGAVERDPDSLAFDLVGSSRIAIAEGRQGGNHRIAVVRPGRVAGLRGSRYQTSLFCKVIAECWCFTYDWGGGRIEGGLVGLVDRGCGVRWQWGRKEPNTTSWSRGDE